MDVLGHVISHDGVGPNKDKIASLTRMPMPTDIKQFRSSLGGLSYYLKFLLNLAKRVCQITALLKNVATFSFTPSMEEAVCALLTEFAAPPILVFLHWDAVIDCSRLFRLHCDANTDGLGATLEQNSLTAMSAPSSRLVKQHSLMSETGPPWSLKPDASCGVSGAFAAIYSVSFF